MQFLKTLFWVLIAVAAVVFAMYNWVAVPLALWGGLALEVKLPLLLLVAFLLGLLPMLVVHRTTRWRLRRRLDAAERSLAEREAAAAGLGAPPAPPSSLASPLPLS